MIERIHRDFYVNVFRPGKLNRLLRSLCERIEHSRYLWATNFNSAVLTEKNCKYIQNLSVKCVRCPKIIAFFLSNWRDLRFSTIKTFVLAHSYSVTFKWGIAWTRFALGKKGCTYYLKCGFLKKSFNMNTFAVICVSLIIQIITKMTQSVLIDENNCLPVTR